jgi:glycosyltransferase involved in cell wall biosynthesis
MPAYNVAVWISDALRSVFTQTFQNFEVIVVNDGSPDSEDLEAAIAPWRARLVYIRQANGGVAAARNTALRHARAPVIAQLDPDDMWEPDYLQSQLGVLNSDPGIHVVFPDLTFVGATPHAGRRFQELFPTADRPCFHSVLAGRRYIPYPVTARKDEIMRAGAFDSELRSAEDFDLWLRILHRGGQVAFNPRPLVRYRFRPGSLTQNGVQMASHRVRVLEKCLRTLRLTDVDRRELQAAIRRDTATVDLLRGREAFMAGDMRTAREHLGRANRYLNRPKLTALLWMLRLAPDCVRLGLPLLRSRAQRQSRMLAVAPAAA